MSILLARRQAIAALVGGLTAAMLPRQAFASPLEKVRALGLLKVAVYKDFEPWSWKQDGVIVGIDVDLAKAMAEAIGVRAEVQEFLAGDELADDLRNMVWRGTVVQGQPADVMMHVPVDRKLAIDNDRAVILAPYYRESFGMACNRDTIECEVPPPQLKGKRLVVEIASIPDLYLTGGFGGALRNDVRHVDTGSQAVAAVASGDADATVATVAQIEHGTKPDGRIVRRKSGVPLIGNPGWNVGIAVKDDSRDLGDELEKVIGVLASNGKLDTIFAKYGVSPRAPVLG